MSEYEPGKVVPNTITDFSMHTTEKDKAAIAEQPAKADDRKPFRKRKKRSHAEAMTFLQKHFPKIFPNKPNLPLLLAVGIHNDLFTFLKTFPEKPISHNKLLAALRQYTRKGPYLRALMEGLHNPSVPRYNLKGQPCGTVSEEQAQIAKKMWVQRRAANRRNKRRKPFDNPTEPCAITKKRRLRRYPQIIHLSKKVPEKENA